MYLFMLAHAATFAPLQSANSQSDSYMLHSGKAVLNSKLNCQSLKAPHTRFFNLLAVHANCAHAPAIYSSFHSHAHTDSHRYAQLYPHPPCTSPLAPAPQQVHSPHAGARGSRGQITSTTVPHTMDAGVSSVCAPTNPAHHTHVTKHAGMHILFFSLCS